MYAHLILPETLDLWVVERLWCLSYRKVKRDFCYLSLHL